MSIEYSELAPGDVVSHRRFNLDANTIREYLVAVGDTLTTPPSHETDLGLVPPMAVAALSLRGVINDLDIPKGTLHTNQELVFEAPVRSGPEFECKATILQNSVRGGRRFIVVGLTVEHGDQNQVMTGKSTLMLPGV